MNHKITHPHDKLVKKFMEDPKVAIAFFERHLPDHMLAKLNLSSLNLANPSSITSSWQRLHIDLLFRCQLACKAPSYLYLLIEHQSTSDPWISVRLMRYQANLWSQYLDRSNPPKKLPPILTFLLYHGKRPYPHTKAATGCFTDPSLAGRDAYQPMCLIDLAALSKVQLLEKPRSDTLFKFLLKYSHTPDLIERVQLLMNSDPMLFSRLSQTQQRFVLDYLLDQAKATPKELMTIEATLARIRSS